MRVDVEFLGLSRLATGRKAISLELEAGTTFREIVGRLGQIYPAMIGDVIQSDGETLQAPNALLDLGARQIIRADGMGGAPGDGDRLVLMSVPAGG